MSDKSESFERIMNMTIHTLDETSMSNVSKMWVYIEEQQGKLQASAKRERILREAVALLDCPNTDKWVCNCKVCKALEKVKELR